MDSLDEFKSQITTLVIAYIYYLAEYQLESKAKSNQKEVGLYTTHLVCKPIPNNYNISWGLTNMDFSIIQLEN
jgi:hypothetical protein